MKKVGNIVLVLFGLFLIPLHSHAQENKEIDIEESAEVYLEEYSDQFQENFFEALKQKGIENYDRAINLFLECKILDPENAAVDYELARAYLADQQYIFAQEYALEALISEPANYWYLDILFQILQKQGSSIEKIKSKIPFDNEKLRENLVLLYFKEKDYEEALNILKEVKPTSFKQKILSKINDSIKREEAKSPFDPIPVQGESITDIIGSYKFRINGHMASNNLQQLQQLSEEALESYPSQPYFYYTQGYALNKKGEYKAAISVLESALDYLLNDIPLANKIYQELAEAYTALHNTSKANMYLRMVKPGF